MPLFLSSFVNKVDKKGRVSVPASFRSVLEPSGKVVLYTSFINDCIEGCDTFRIEKMCEAIDSMDPYSGNRDAFATAILGGSISLSLDSEGRIILPESLLEEAQITNSVTFVGKGTSFEIWNPEQFAIYLREAREIAKKNRGVLKFSNSEGV